MYIYTHIYIYIHAYIYVSIHLSIDCQSRQNVVEFQLLVFSCAPALWSQYCLLGIVWPTSVLGCWSDIECSTKGLTLLTISVDAPVIGAELFAYIRVGMHACVYIYIYTFAYSHMFTYIPAWRVARSLKEEPRRHTAAFRMPCRAP